MSTSTVVIGILIVRWAFQAAAIFALVYFGARLAIRHERRLSS